LVILEVPPIKLFLINEFFNFHQRKLKKKKFNSESTTYLYFSAIVLFPQSKL